VVTTELTHETPTDRACHRMLHMGSKYVGTQAAYGGAGRWPIKFIEPTTRAVPSPGFAPRIWSSRRWKTIGMMALR